MLSVYGMLKVKEHNVRFSTQPHLVPSTCYYCWILLNGRFVLWNKQSVTLKHSRFSTCLSDRMLRDLKVLSQEHKSRQAEMMGQRCATSGKINIIRKCLWGLSAYSFTWTL